MTRQQVLQKLEVPALIITPLSLAVCAALSTEQAALVALVVAVLAILLFFASYEASRPSLRQIMPTVVLAALAAAGRILFAPFPDVKPVLAITIMAGVMFGRRSGFMVGALAALVSNFFFGQGAWTPWQMYAWGLMGYLAGCLADAGFLKRNASILAFGFLAALLYGFILNSWSIIGFARPLTWQIALAGYAAGFALDLTQGIATVVFLSVLYVPWSKKLSRIKTKYALKA